MRKTCALLLFLLIASASEAAVLSDTHFNAIPESGVNCGGYPAYPSYAPVIEALTGTALANAPDPPNALKISYPAGFPTGYQTAWCGSNHLNTDEVYGQIYVFFPTGYEFNRIANKLTYTYLESIGGDNPGDVLFGHFDQTQNSPFFQTQGRNTPTRMLYPNKSGRKVLQYNTWYKMSWYLKLNTNGVADGVVRAWIDDVLALEYTDVALRGDGSAGNFGARQYHRVGIDPVWGGGAGASGAHNKILSDYWYADRFIWSTTPITAGQDLSPPYTDTNTPAKNSTGWPVASRTVSQYVRDSSNVTRSSISLTLDGALPAKTCDSGLTCTPTGATAPSYLVTYTHGTDWADNTIYTIAFSARDASASGNLLSETWTFQTALAAPETLAVTTTTLSNGQVGVPFLATLAATGGVSPYTWDNTTPLPAGLNIPPSGTGSWGVPTATFSGNITVRVTDAVGTTDTQVISLTIDAAAVPEYPTIEISTVADTYVRSGDVQNYSTADLLRLYTFPVNTASNRIQMIWDLSSAAGAVPTTATLRLYMTGCSGSCGTDPYDITVHRFTGLAPVIDNASWFYYNGSTAWTGGADGGFSDAGAAEATASVSAVPGYYTIDVTDMVKAWLLDPSSNKGMLINPPVSATSDSDRIFASSENPTVAYRPVLFLTYVPEPTPNQSLTGGVLTGGVIQ